MWGSILTHMSIIIRNAEIMSKAENSLLERPDAYTNRRRQMKFREEIVQTNEITAVKTEWSDLMTASFNGDVEKVNTLLKEDVNWQDSNGVTALMLASREGHTELVRILLEKGAQVNMQKKFGTSALIIASKRGHTEVVKLLLDHGAHVNKQGEGWMSPLMMASQYGRTEVVKLLILNNADVNVNTTKCQP